ncbi:hypothetical protein, partial [Streptomyces decoyicus]|uniref:hypothetical protein n=1 Tax=Streptomyces decoyicus TaxID=249567 RepID=UPI0033BF4990
RARAVTTEDAEYPADVVVLGLGVRPETTLAAAAVLCAGAALPCRAPPPTSLFSPFLAEGAHRAHPRERIVSGCR